MTYEKNHKGWVEIGLLHGEIKFKEEGNIQGRGILKKKVNKLAAIT